MTNTLKTQINEESNISVYGKASMFHDLVVVMPAYNEGAHIKDNLIKACNIISSFSNDFIIIAVNDGSKDDTKASILEAIKFDNRICCASYIKNKGKGGAIATGVNIANGNYIAFLDSDLELNPSMLKDFIAQMNKNHADIAIGSKMHKDSKLDYPPIRKLLSLGYYIYLKLLFRLNLKDTQTGIKVFKGKLIKSICKNLSTYGFAFDIEILAIAAKNNCKIIEMPIELKFTRTKDNKSRISIKQIFRMIKDTFKIKKNISRNIVIDKQRG